MTYSYTFTSKVYTTYDQTKTLGDRNWKASGTNVSYFGYNSTKGQQFGSASDPCYSLNVTVTTDFTNISSIYITTSGASGTTATLKIYIGSTVYGERTLTSESTTYRVTPGGATGRVSFKYTQSTASGKAKAIYIKEIKVYYTSVATGVFYGDELGLFKNSTDITTLTNNDYDDNDLFTLYPSVETIYYNKKEHQL